MDLCSLLHVRLVDEWLSLTDRLRLPAWRICHVCLCDDFAQGVLPRWVGSKDRIGHRPKAHVGVSLVGMLDGAFLSWYRLFVANEFFQKEGPSF